MGRMLKDARTSKRLTQQQASDRAGISRSAWSGLEVSGDGRITLATWNRAATAVDSQLEVYLKRTTAATEPRDAAHLRNQELVIRTVRPGGWRALPEAAIDRDARTTRAADVLLSRGEPATEYVIVEVWDWFDDVGGALREFDRRLAALERYAIARMHPDQPLPRTSGCWVVRATHRNRQLVADHRHVFRARFPCSGGEWLLALGRPTAPAPDQPALLWVSVNGERLFASRLGSKQDRQTSG
jgi:transcriptional regulator with XRE-family HTH domain